MCLYLPVRLSSQAFCWVPCRFAEVPFSLPRQLCLAFVQILIPYRLPVLLLGVLGMVVALPQLFFLRLGGIAPQQPLFYGGGISQ